MDNSLHIAIVGGGPGGLTLALLLARNGIAASVFERESHALERPQGGTLDLHEDAGLEALRRAGLIEEFNAIARYEDQGARLLDKHGQLLFEHLDAADGDRPEVDRTALRNMLLDALPPGTVRWGQALKEVRACDDGRWVLLFEDGHEQAFDLVIGADGAWSRVRPLLSPYRPQYSGLTLLELGIDDVDRRHPALADLVGRGKMGVEADCKAIIAQRNGNAHIRVYVIFRVPHGWAEQRFDLAAPASVREELVKDFAGFAEPIRDLFRAANDNIAPRPIYALPVGHCWTNRRGLTLIGDAAHVMSPFGGDGVNNAMRDAVELATLLTQGPDWEAAVAAYETQMFARTIPSAEGAAEAAATQLSHIGEELTLQMYRSHVVGAS